MVWSFLESRQIFKFDDFPIKKIVKFKNSVYVHLKSYRLLLALLFIYEPLATTQKKYAQKYEALKTKIILFNSSNFAINS
jgi:hypothetical protein